MQTEIHNSIADIASEKYFYSEMLEFRQVMGSTKFTLDQKDDGFRAITLLYFNLPNATETNIMHYTALAKEWTIRRIYEEMRK